VNHAKRTADAILKDLDESGKNSEKQQAGNA